MNKVAFVFELLICFILNACSQNSQGQNLKKTTSENIHPDPNMKIYSLGFSTDTCLYFGIEHLPTRKVGIWHKERGIIISPEYTSAWQLNNCKWLVMSKGVQKAIFDTLGNQLTKFENNFEIIATASNFDDIAVVHRADNKFLIKPPSIEPINGEEFREIRSFNKNGFFAFASKDEFLFALGRPDGTRITDFKYPTLDVIGVGMDENSYNLNNLKKGRYLVAYALLDKGIICLDNQGEEVPCKP